MKAKTLAGPGGIKSHEIKNKDLTVFTDTSPSHFYLKLFRKNLPNLKKVSMDGKTSLVDSIEISGFQDKLEIDSVTEQKDILFTISNCRNINISNNQVSHFNQRTVLEITKSQVFIEPTVDYNCNKLYIDNSELTCYPTQVKEFTSHTTSNFALRMMLRKPIKITESFHLEMESDIGSFDDYNFDNLDTTNAEFEIVFKRHITSFKGFYLKHVPGTLRLFDVDKNVSGLIDMANWVYESNTDASSIFFYDVEYAIMPDLKNLVFILADFLRDNKNIFELQEYLIDNELDHHL